MKLNNTLSLCVCVLCLSLLFCVSMSAQSNAAQIGVITKSEFNPAIQSDVSPPLRDLIDSQPVSTFGYHLASPHLNPKLQKQLQFAAQRGESNAKFDENAPVQQLAPVNASVGVNVLGVGIGFHGYSVPDAPTDSNGASGDWPGNEANAQVVEWVNVSYAVFRKSDGAYLAGPILGNALWSGFGGGCQTSNSGDIVVQFDKTHHRWILFQPKFSSPFLSCFAVSTSPDALGTYYRYSFPQTAGFPDYPKLGLQADAIYQSQNIFNNAGTRYLGARPCAYNLTKMLVGDSTAEQVCTLDNSNGSFFDDSMLPADLDTPSMPLPAGTPEVFVGSIDNFASETNIYMYTYKPDFVAHTATLTCTATNSSGAGTCPIATGLPAFVGLCGFGSSACVPQLGSADNLDSLGDRLMFRLALHRNTNAANVPTTWSYLVSHAIVSGSTGAQRWYEFQAPAGSPTALAMYQGGTYAPDATYRFMGSIAKDRKGNIAMGYSRSSSTLHPDIYFTGQSSTASGSGTMDGEKAIVDQTVATGSQTDTSNRWGDYSSMTIDPDGCNFWYVNQYYTTTTTFHWSTRVASLKFNNCTPIVLP